MNVQRHKIITLFFIGLSLFTASTSFAASESEKYEEIEWIQLMPEDDLNALLNPPSSIMNIQDGSEQDSVDALGKMTDGDEDSQRFYNALKSTRIVESFDKKHIRLPGFIVPLETDDNNKVTEFFIVPYFGACLHMPPPPPNQIVHAKFKEGFELASLYDPFWFEGQLVIEGNEHALGTSAYSIKLDALYPYEG